MMTVILIFLVGSGVNGVGSETIILFFFCLLVPVYFYTNQVSFDAKQIGILLLRMK